MPKRHKGNIMSETYTKDKFSTSCNVCGKEALTNSCLVCEECVNKHTKHYLKCIHCDKVNDMSIMDDLEDDGDIWGT